MKKEHGQDLGSDLQKKAKVQIFDDPDLKNFKVNYNTYDSEEMDDNSTEMANSSDGKVDSLDEGAGSFDDGGNADEVDGGLSENFQRLEDLTVDDSMTEPDASLVESDDLMIELDTDQNLTSISKNEKRAHAGALEGRLKNKDDMKGGLKETLVKTENKGLRAQNDNHKRDEKMVSRGTGSVLAHGGGRIIGEDEAKVLLEKAKLEAEANLKNKHSQTKKIITVIVIGLIVIAVASVGVWLFRQGHQNENKTESNAGQSSKQEPAGNVDVKTESQVVELPKNDEEVLRLYSTFANLSDGLSFFYENELQRPDQAHLTRLGIVLNNMDMVECRMTEEGDLERRYGENYADLKDDADVDLTRCFDGEQVREKAREIFAELPQFDMAMVAPGAPLADRTVSAQHMLWAYDKELDEFYSYGSEIDNCFHYIRQLYKAEKDDKHIYLYEKIIYQICYPGEEVDEAGMVTEQTDDGTRVKGSDVLNGEKFAEFEDQVDSSEQAGMIEHIKWTFVKNANGNYVFEKLEEVTEE